MSDYKFKIGEVVVAEDIHALTGRYVVTITEQGKATEGQSLYYARVDRVIEYRADSYRDNRLKVGMVLWFDEIELSEYIKPNVQEAKGE